MNTNSSRIVIKTKRLQHNVYIITLEHYTIYTGFSVSDIATFQKLYAEVALLLNTSIIM